MYLDIPVPEDYDVSSEYGFLPADPPPELLPDPYYAPWNRVAHSLQSLLRSRQLRAAVDCMPILACDRLEKTSHLRRAYSTLAFICHAYIWEEEDAPAKVVPPSISIPFLAVCKSLKLPPVATYAAVVLWNFRCLSSAERLDSLENLTAIVTFTGAIDESWFYCVSVAIEARAGPLVPVVLDAIRAVQAKDTPAVVRHLRQLLAGLEEIPILLQRMYESCSPHVFYHRIRPFLAGSKNVSKAGQPDGVVFDDGTGRMDHVQFSGGSNAQSSLIQFFDIALGITHRATSEGVVALSGERNPTASALDKGSCKSKDAPNFITDMRQYMPLPHRQFLEHLSCVANIRGYVESNHRDEGLASSYNACVTTLVKFRTIHLQMVSRYILLQAPKIQRPLKTQSKSMWQWRISRRSCNEDGFAGRKSAGAALGKGLIGTGGTALLPFLKQVRDETRQFLTRPWRSTGGGYEH